MPIPDPRPIDFAGSRTQRLDEDLPKAIFPVVFEMRRKAAQDLVMLGNGSGVPVGAPQEFADAAANERIRRNVGGSQTLAPIRRDSQILVRCPIESLHLLEDQPERPFRWKIRH
jgi:hypothetical protein